MSPQRAAEDFLDGAAVDAVAIRDPLTRFASSGARADVQNVGFAETGVSVSLAPMIGSEPWMLGTSIWRGHETTTLRTHVGEVVSVGAEEQMLRSDTPAIVAVMTDMQTIRDWPEVHFPRKAVGVHGGVLASESAAHDSVTVASSGGPLPAAVADSYLRPEPIHFTHR